MSFDVTDENRPHLIEWLNDRGNFNIWFVSIITASFMGLTIFGELKPGFKTPQAQYLAISMMLLIVSLLLNFVSAWSIPGWKLKLNTRKITNSRWMYYELSATTWVGVIAFVVALTLGLISNIGLEQV